MSVAADRADSDRLVERVERLSWHKRALFAERVRTLTRQSVPSDPSGNAERDSSQTGESDPALVAYVVPQGERLPDIAELRAFLKGELPEHMIPSSFVQLDALPRTPNGKVDRRALVDLERPPVESGATFVEPSTEDEIALATIWAEVLGTDLVGVHDNFFEIGGHSLLAIRLLGRIREAFEVDLPMDALFEAPTITGIAARVNTLRWARASRNEKPGVAGGDDREEFEL